MDRAGRIAAARVMRQRDQLLEALRRLVTFGELGEQPGAIYAEVHVDHLRAAGRVLRRIQRQVASDERSLRDASQSHIVLPSQHETRKDLK